MTRLEIAQMRVDAYGDWLEAGYKGTMVAERADQIFDIEFARADAAERALLIAEGWTPPAGEGE